MRNEELLAILVGKKAAKNLSSKNLLDVFGFVTDNRCNGLVMEAGVGYVVHEKLMAAKELVARCMQESMRVDGFTVDSPAVVRNFLCTRIGALEHEAFWCLWLDAQRRLIDAEEMFRGTVSQTSVYPREIVKRALGLNASSVIFAHNHPSGITEPSSADRSLTTTLTRALELVDVRVLDHFVVAGNTATSFAEKGLL